MFRELKLYRGIRLLGVAASGFDDFTSVSLFGEEEKKENLYEAIDKIKQRFGEKGITKANLIK